MKICDAIMAILLGCVLGGGCRGAGDTVLVDASNMSSRRDGNSVGNSVGLLRAGSLEPSDIPRILSKIPKPTVSLTDSSAIVESDSKVPLIILINHSGKELTDYTQVAITSTIGDQQVVITYGRGTLANGKQKIIVPYLCHGGTVKLVYQLGERAWAKSWNGRGPLLSEVPLVLTVQRGGRVTSNPPYKGD